MLFWIIAAFMTTAATACVIYPLSRRRAAEGGPDLASHDIEVYRDQLSEVDRDLAGGLIGAQEADVARTEIGRRLLLASRRAKEDAAGAGFGRGTTRLALVATLVFVPAVALVAYLSLGSPGLPQQPLAARLNVDPENADISVLIASAERHLATNPEDGRGWDVLAPIYLRTGRTADAANAYRKAISYLGPSAPRQSGLGEALVTEAGGIVTEEARLVFQSARELDPEDPRPPFFLAVALAQDGKTDEAKAAFTALIERSPADAPWIPAIRSQIAALEQAPDTAVSIPSAGEIAAAAAGKSPAEQQAMIQGMVSSIEEKLAANPENLDGWLLLIRSRAVLGDLPAAQGALDKAMAIFPTGPGAEALSRLAGEFGLKAAAGLGGVPLNPAAPQPVQPEVDGAKSPFFLPETGTAPEAPGNPTAADMAAAQSMSAEDRTAMIAAMVASLDARLADNPDNIEGWLRLVRSYHVLGDAEAARTALARAEAAFEDGSEERQALADLAGELAIKRQDRP